MIDFVMSIRIGTKVKYNNKQSLKNGSSPFIRRNNKTGWLFNEKQGYSSTSRHPFNILTEEIYD